MSSLAEGDCSDSRQAKPKLPREVWVLITANVVVALGYGVVAPVLPQYARNFGVSISAATFVITAFALMRLVSAPASGLLVQRLGERRVYISGLLIVAVSTGACAFAQTYWQLLLFRSLGGFGSAMFTVSSLGLMIRISPPDARGRVAGLFSSAFLIGSVGGPVLGSLTAGLGLAAPFVIYGVALLVAAPWCSSACGIRRWRRPRGHRSRRCRCGSCCATGPIGPALFSNFATGWSAFGLRIALVPLFVVEVLGRGAGFAGLALATFAIGNVSAVIPSGYLSDRVGRRKLLIVGLTVSAVATVLVGFTSSLPVFLAAALRDRRGDRHLHLAAAGRGRRHRRQQGPRRHRGGDVPDDGRLRRDRRLAGGRPDRRSTCRSARRSWSAAAILLVAAVGWVFAPETRGLPPAEHTPARALGPEAGGEVP